MKNLLLLLITSVLTITHFEAHSQMLYNKKNVDRTAMSYFDGPQTFRALEYTVDQDPQSEKVYRLQTMPENGYPAITLQGINLANNIYFEDKAPYDDQYSDNPTPYLSSEAVQTFYASQEVMKALGQRFGWKGLDGNGQIPIDVFLKDTDELNDPNISPSFGQYALDPPYEYFSFNRRLSSNKPFNNVLEIMGSLFSHAIIHHKTGIQFLEADNCKKALQIENGICDIMGIYIKNKILKQGPPAFDWQFQKQVKNPPEDFSNPKSYQYPDTYGGQNFPIICSEETSMHPASGPLLKWFYFLTEGFAGAAYNDLGYGYSNLVPIGPEKAIQIVWDAIPSIKIYSDYPAFKQFTLQAAEKLYGLHSTEYIAVQNAWCAVGVCDNNPVGFSMSPNNASSNVNPWPSVNVNLTWQNSSVQEWEVQMSTKYDFSESVQNITTDNFTTILDQNGLLSNYAILDGYYHPGETVYARAKVTKADPSFCKGLNPLCAFYQQFGPIHAFVLKDQKIEFWPDNNLSIVVNPWDKPDLRWKSIQDADRYRIQVATDNAFNDLIFDDVVLHTGNFTESGEINTLLEQGKNYYARVRAERLDFVKINKNYGAWSDVVSLYTAIPQTSIIQALNQGINDPAKAVSSLGFWINWYSYPGVSSYVIQVALDNAFNNIVRSQTVPANINTVEVLLPPTQDQTNLFVRVLPQHGAAFGVCNNVWRVKTDEDATIPLMKGPPNGSSFPFKKPIGTVFEWKGGTLNLNLVDHFQLHVTENTSGVTSVFTTQGKIFDFFVQDPLIFVDKMGIKAKVLAVNSLGAKSALSPEFNYNICPDHPGVFFPGDLGKVDPSVDFHIEWHPSEWFDPGSQFLVTILDGVNPVPGFNNKTTTNNFMLVPAGTLVSGKSYTVTVKNSSSCAGLNVPKTFFNAVASGGSNQPDPPKLVNFTIDLNAFRNDPDGLAWGTSNYRLGIELIDPDGNVLADQNGNQITQLDVDSENSGVVIIGDKKPQGKYKLRIKMLDVFPPITYYPFDQPFFSVFLNGNPIVVKHVITADFLNPASPFHQFQSGFQFDDVFLDIK